MAPPYDKTRHKPRYTLRLTLRVTGTSLSQQHAAHCGRQALTVGLPPAPPLTQPAQPSLIHSFLPSFSPPRKTLPRALQRALRPLRVLRPLHLLVQLPVILQPERATRGHETPPSSPSSPPSRKTHLVVKSVSAPIRMAMRPNTKPVQTLALTALRGRYTCTAEHTHTRTAVLQHGQCLAS
jgi:hypothetical protein